MTSENVKHNPKSSVCIMFYKALVIDNITE